MDPTTEIRFLPASERTHLCSLLDVADHWKELAAVLRKPDNKPGMLISAASMHLLDQQKLKVGGSPSQALFDYWSTSGRRRPTIEDLVNTLKECNLIQAANLVRTRVLSEKELDFDLLNGNGKASSNSQCSSSEFLKTDPNKENHWMRDTEGVRLAGLSPTAPNMIHTEDLRPSSSNSNAERLSSGPAAARSSPLYNFHSCSDNNATVDSELQTLLHEYSIVQIPHKVILGATKNLSDEFKLGEGAFGAVYRVNFSEFPSKSSSLGVVAVKILKSELNGKQFVNELRVMSKFRHENLLSLVAMSTDSPTLCLLSPFMKNGSLLDALACRNPTDVSLPARTRIQIAIGTARGIVHLHTANGEEAKPFVHRDIKSANILLDEDYTAKVGDFGLVRMGSACTGTTKTTPLATSVIGTSVYMAPEAFRGDVSVKLDTFSFGVVLLELLTGLAPFDEDREEPDILSYVDDKLSESSSTTTEVDLSRRGPTDTEDRVQSAEGEHHYSSIVSILDSKAKWDEEEATARTLLCISRDATAERKKVRPTMQELLPRMEALLR